MYGVYSRHCIGGLPSDEDLSVFTMFMTSTSHILSHRSVHGSSWLMTPPDVRNPQELLASNTPKHPHAAAAPLRRRSLRARQGRGALTLGEFGSACRAVGEGPGFGGRLHGWVRGRRPSKQTRSLVCSDCFLSMMTRG